MSWHEVDMAADPRGGQFAYFQQMVDPFAGVTAAVDITDFLAALDGRPFFLSLLYEVTRAANRVPQLRRRILDGRVVEYDWCSPSYTLMKPDGVYVYSLIEGERTYGDFIAEGQRQQALSLDRGTLTEDGDPLGNFFVSCLPWLDYLQVKHPVVSADDSNPRHQLGPLYRARRPRDAARLHLRQPRARRRAAHRAVLQLSRQGAARTCEAAALAGEITQHRNQNKQ